MKKLLGAISVLCLIAITSGGCYYDNEEELYPTSAVCDTTNLTYTNQIEPIINLNCYSCHSISANPVSGGGYCWEGYANISAYLAAPGGTTIFLERINGTGTGTPMPKNAPKLSDCNINILETWINNGYPQ